MGEKAYGGDGARHAALWRMCLLFTSWESGESLLAGTEGPYVVLTELGSAARKPRTLPPTLSHTPEAEPRVSGIFPNPSMTLQVKCEPTVQLKCDPQQTINKREAWVWSHSRPGIPPQHPQELSGVNSKHYCV